MGPKNQLSEKRVGWVKCDFGGTDVFFFWKQAGLYNDFVMLLDFNSLYPSIIQDWKMVISESVNARPDRFGAEVA